MSHVDEGALHAYLDGALDEYAVPDARRIREHLEQCGTCAGRLEAERRVREDAAVILDSAVPHVEVPTLEELRTFARSLGPEGGQVRSPAFRQRFGWAASVILAVGLGWVLRGGEATRVGSFQGDEVEVAARQPSPAVEPTQAVAEATAVGARAEVATTGTAFEARAAEVLAPARTETELALADAAEDDGVAMEKSSAEQRLARAEEAADELLIATPSPTAQGLVAVIDVVNVVAGQALESLEPSPSAPSDEDVPPARRDVRAPLVRSALSQSGTAAAGAATLERTVGRDARERAEDQEPEPGSMVVPGLEVLDIGWLGEGVTQSGVRVLQRLERGDTLELIHLPEGFDPDAVSGPVAGWNELRVPRDGGWLILRAPLDRDALEGLRARLDAIR